MSAVRWWRDGPPRLRLRRRLLVFSAPVAVVLVLALVKSASVVIAGDSAAVDFAARDADALRGDVATLSVANVVEPAKAFFAAGGLAVLEGRLEDAVAQFGESLARTDPSQSCPARINLELVQETLGDRAFESFDAQAAVGWYLSAATVVDDAPGQCFAGNDDSDRQRRAVRNDAADRLENKIDGARVVPPPPPPPSEPAPPPPPPPPGGSTPGDQDTQLRLDPGRGDPLDRLQQILRDAAAAPGRSSLPRR